MHLPFLLLFIVFSSLYCKPLYIYSTEDKATPITNWRFSVENENGIQPEANSEEWSTVTQTDIWKQNDGKGKGIRWYRRELFFPEPLPVHEGLSIYIPALLTSYELYWDNKHIGGSGKVSEFSKEETAGKSGQIFTLSPKQSSAGKHTIALRVSNHNTISGGLSEPISIGSTKNVVHTLFLKLGVSLFLCGIFTITAILHFFIVGSRKRHNSHILFSLFALSCGGHILVTTLIGFGEVSLNLYYPLAFSGDLFWFGMITLLPLFLLSHFLAYGKRYTAAIILIISATIVILPRLALYDIVPIRFLRTLSDLNLFYAYFSVLVSMIIVIGALSRKRKGSKTILLGMVIFLIGLIITTLFGISNGWSTGFAFLNIFITVAISRQFAEERRNYYKTELRASRLELELLKKHIQPHFLLNSLNSIVAWIEEEPVVAGRLVNALSNELRLLMAYAGERKIHLSQEIKICKTHLQVMSMRQEKQFILELKGEKEGIEIPPFILHTIIENGISHGFRKKEEGIFTLTTTRVGGTVKLELHNNGDSTPRQSSEGKGTGTRYIRSRMQELYGTNYEFSTRSVSDGWMSTITFSEAKA